MLTPSLALLERAFRVDSRQLRGHLLRVVFLGLMFIALSVAYFQSLMFGAPGLQLFTWIIWQTVVFVTLGGVGFFATAISEEKDEATLGLLRMAGISPVSLLLGKSTTRLISAVLILAVQFPFTLLAVTLGGVTLHQIVSAYVAILAFLLFVANLGLFCSVFASTSGRASTYTGVLLILYFALPPLVSSLAPAAGGGTIGWGADELLSIAAAAAEWLYETSLFTRLNTILTTGFPEPVFGAQVLGNALLAAGLFLLSWAIFERCTREAGAMGAVGRGSPFLGQVVSRRKSRRAWRHALVWKDFYFLAGGTTLLVAKMVAYGVIALGIACTSRGRETNGTAIMIIMLSLLALELSYTSSRLFSEEVRGQTWSSLMMLPSSTARIAYAKTAGILLGALPAAFYFCVGVALAPNALGNALLNGFILFPLGWYGVLQFVVFLHVTALMSLLVKWGSLPLSFGVMYLVHSCISPVAFLPLILSAWSGGAIVAIVPIVIANLGVIFVFQIMIHERLERLGGQ